ncbi:MAG TPA: HemK2/MTQ2 family protein methyltransferase [Actinomycetota bacterium]|nr:HemK2/MTQ2 family protein methyltransferase [Actinomycetota bacterium]
MKLLRLPGVHKPVSDTWILADAMRQELRPGARVADICTGTGALAISAAQAGAGEVVGVDLTLRAVVFARLNARLNGARIRVRRGDLFGPLAGEKFDVIVSNPPYIPAETEELPRRGTTVPLDAGLDGRALLDRICAEAPDHLLPGGVVLLVHSSICGTEKTVEALAAGGLQADVVFRKPGKLGPVMTARAAMMRERGLLGPEDEEEIVVVRGRLAEARMPSEAVG